MQNPLKFALTALAVAFTGPVLAVGAQPSVTTTQVNQLFQHLKTVRTSTTLRIVTESEIVLAKQACCSSVQN